MFARVHKASETLGGNKGSCTDLATYLDKEKDNNLKFFSHSENDISIQEVVNSIDNNRAQIGKEEAKFFMLTLNPSEKELCSLIGYHVNDINRLIDSDKEMLFSKIEDFTRESMNKYALNFERPTVQSGDDLMYFARIETERLYKKTDIEVKEGLKKIGQKKEGLQVHVHVIVSRKSKDGKVKLSPNAKSSGNEWELKERGNVKRGFSHDKWKLDVQEVFKEKFKYEFSANEVYSSKVIPKEDVLFKTTNADLKSILENHTITSANQVSYLMKQQGYDYKFYRGNHIFKKENETFSIKNNEIKPFVQRISDDKMKDILQRFNLLECEKKEENYIEKGISIEKISFQDNKTLKKVDYFVVYDKETNSSISLSRLKNFAFDNHIKMVDRNLHLGSIENKDLRDVLSDKNIRTLGQVEHEMTKKGYECSSDEKNYIFRKGTITYSLKKTHLNSLVYEVNSFKDSNLSSKVANNVKNKAKGKVKNKVENKVIQELTGGHFNAEIKTARTTVRAAKFVLNPKAAIIQELKNLFRLEKLKEM